MGEDTYEGDINNPLTLNLYTYVKNNPLRYTDPMGHEAVPNIDWSQLYKESLKVIEGGAGGAKKGKSGGWAGRVLGGFLGILGSLVTNPNPVGESQEDINAMKAELLNLSLISSNKLQEYKDDNNKTLVYRAMNDADLKTVSSGVGVVAKNPIGDWSIEDHILFGSNEEAWEYDPWISTTADPGVAVNNFNGKYNGVLVIDLSKIGTNKLSFPILELQPGSLAHRLAVADKEVLIKYSIPQEAILGIHFGQ